MSRRRITMNKYLGMLRLRHDCGRSIRQVADALGVGTGTPWVSTRINQGPPISIKSAACVSVCDRSAPNTARPD